MQRSLLIVFLVLFSTFIIWILMDSFIGDIVALVRVAQEPMEASAESTARLRWSAYSLYCLITLTVAAYAARRPRFLFPFLGDASSDR